MLFYDYAKKIGYSVVLSLLFPTRIKLSVAGPLDFAYYNHLATCWKLYLLETS